MQHKYIFLTGFMGAGKSTVGVLLARELGLDFIDTDQIIMQRCGMNIKSIFAHYGEAYFRSCETFVLKNIDCRSVTGKVVSTGGGIVGLDENICLMRERGTVIYLHASWETLKQRLSDVSDRPLALNGSDQKLYTLWKYRLPLYRKADMEIDTSGLSPQSVVDNIMPHLKGCGSGESC
jgi:shikimate kinase